MYKKVIDSPVGKIEIIEENEKIIELNIYNEKENNSVEDIAESLAELGI